MVLLRVVVVVKLIVLSVFVIVKVICLCRFNMSVSVRCGCGDGGGSGGGCDTGRRLWRCCRVEVGRLPMSVVDGVWMSGRGGFGPGCWL